MSLDPGDESLEAAWAWVHPDLGFYHSDERCGSWGGNLGSVMYASQSPRTVTLPTTAASSVRKALLSPRIAETRNV